MNLQEIDDGFRTLDQISREELRAKALGCPAISQCLAIVEEFYGVSRLDLLSTHRLAKIAQARQLVMWLARRSTIKSLPQIARVLRRDHTTVMHGITATDARRECDPAFRDMSDKLLARLRPS